MQTRTSHSSNRRRWAHCLGGGLTALVATATVVSPAGAATSSNRPTGASGSVAALNGSTMEVQNANSGQTTVSWTSTTTFSKTVTETVSSLAAGDCVSVTGTASKKSKTTIAARSITVTQASSSGSCTAFGGRAAGGLGGRPGGPGGFAGARGSAGGTGGGPGGFGEGGNGTRRSFPSGGSGGGNFRRQLASLSVANGKVTAVTGSTVSVSGSTLSLGDLPRRNASSNNADKTKKPAAPKTEKLTITTSGSTTLSTTQSASSSDLAVGDCVSAFGPAATNGAVAATTVRITSTGGKSCTAGFAGRGGGFFGGGPGGAGGPGGSGA